MRVPRELEIALNAPIGPQRLAQDTVVVDEDGWYRTITPSSSWPASNEVLFSNVDELSPDRQIDELLWEYRGRGLPLTWCVYPWTRPRDLDARLMTRGAKRSAITALLCSTAHPLELVEGVDIERIDPESTESYETYIKLLSSGYNLPESEMAFRRCRYHQLSTGPEPCMHLFMARCQGIVAGCAAMIIKKDSGHLTGTFVLPEFRASGVFQSLIASRLRSLRKMGISIASAHANQQSAFWVKRFGFQTIFSYDIYQLDPPSAAG